MLDGISAPLETIPDLLVKVVDKALDVPHRSLLARIPADRSDLLDACLARLDDYINRAAGPYRLLRMERVARIQADICRRLGSRAGSMRIARVLEFRAPAAAARHPEDERTAVPGSSGTDAFERLAQSYESLVLEFQREDLRQNLETVRRHVYDARMDCLDFGKEFRVTAPLRLGISSGNASDNHTRSKEKGAKTLNAGIDLASAEGEACTSPLTVAARRLEEPVLRLRSDSAGFSGVFECAADEAGPEAARRFFAYRSQGDEALRLVKQALVHVGIVREDSDDPLADIKTFTGGGGLEIVTRSCVLRGSGLGTSSVLAASILKVLYRMAGMPAGLPDGEYPELYDQSLLLEQSLGFNSGWQDARGAYGGPSAIKDFYAAPGPRLPAPSVTFLPEVDEKEFERRVVLFNTGISRFATRGLNVVLDVYLCRDEQRYWAVVESLSIHDEIVAALRQGDYSRLGLLATDYWRLRCTIDPDATSPTIQGIFEAPEIAPFLDGGLVTGAGGGGFAILISKNGAAGPLKAALSALRRAPEYARSGVVEYRLNARGLSLEECPAGTA